MLKIYFENLGNISTGEVDIKNFTIFTGENNTGKTYVAYSIYSLFDKDFQYNLKEINQVIDELYKNGLYEINLIDFFNKNYEKLKAEIQEAFSKNLSFIFSANDNEFQKLKVAFELNIEDIKDKLNKQEYKFFK